jgi:hypothetical protein
VGFAHLWLFLQAFFQLLSLATEEAVSSTLPDSIIGSSARCGRLLCWQYFPGLDVVRQGLKKGRLLAYRHYALRTAKSSPLYCCAIKANRLGSSWKNGYAVVYKATMAASANGARNFSTRDGLKRCLQYGRFAFSQSMRRHSLSLNCAMFAHHYLWRVGTGCFMQFQPKDLILKKGD